MLSRSVITLCVRYKCHLEVLYCRQFAHLWPTKLLQTRKEREREKERNKNAIRSLSIWHSDTQLGLSLPKMKVTENYTNKRERERKCTRLFLEWFNCRHRKWRCRRSNVQFSLHILKRILLLLFIKLHLLFIQHSSLFKWIHFVYAMH